MFVTTHYLDEAILRTLSIMHAGTILAMGSPSELNTGYELQTIEDVFVRLVGGNHDRRISRSR